MFLSTCAVITMPGVDRFHLANIKYILHIFKKMECLFLGQSSVIHLLILLGKLWQYIDKWESREDGENKSGVKKVKLSKCSDFSLNWQATILFKFLNCRVLDTHKLFNSK